MSDFDKEVSMKDITPDKVWKEYNKMLSYNESVNLFDTVRVNENFFVGSR